MTPEQKARKVETDRAYRERCRERILQFGKQYYQTHKEQAAARRNAWREANREYYLENERVKSRLRYEKSKLAKKLAKEASVDAKALPE